MSAVDADLTEGSILRKLFHLAMPIAIGMSLQGSVVCV